MLRFISSTILFLVVLASVCRADPSVENIRHRLDSRNLEMMETALRDISEGHGDSSLVPDILIAASRLDMPTAMGGDRSLAPRVIDALKAIAQKDGKQAAVGLFRLADRSSAFRDPAIRELFRLPDAVDVIRFVRTSRDPRDLRTLAVIVHKFPPEVATQASVPWIRLALRSDDSEAIIEASGAIETQLKRGTSKDVLKELRPDLLRVLNDEKWLSRGDSDHYLQIMNVHYQVAAAAAKVLGKDDELLAILQKRYASARRMRLSAQDNQEWFETINLARGRPAAIIDPVEDAKRELQAAMNEINDEDFPIKFEPSQAEYVHALLRLLSHAEAEEFIDEFLALPGHVVFRKTLASLLHTSPEDHLRMIAGSNARCLKILSDASQH